MILVEDVDVVVIGFNLVLEKVVFVWVIYNVIFLLDGILIFVGFGIGDIYVWLLGKCEVIKYLKVYVEWMFVMVFDVEGKIIFLVGGDN